MSDYRRPDLLFILTALRLFALFASASAAASSSGAASPDHSPSSVTSIIHVSPGAVGSGANTNDPANLRSALEQAKPGETLVLSPGEYSTSDTIHLDAEGLTLLGSGRVVLRLTGDATCVGLRISVPKVSVIGLDLDATTLSPEQSCEQRAVVSAIAGADSLKLKGLRLIGSTPAGAPDLAGIPPTTATIGIKITNAKAPRLLDLRLTDLPNTAIQISGASDSILVKEVEIRNSGHRAIHIFDSDGSVRIASSHIRGALNEGVFLRQVTGSVLIENNVVESIRYLPSREGGSGIEGGIVHTNLEGQVTTTIRRNVVDIDPRGDLRLHTGKQLLDIDGIEVNLFGDARGFALIEENHVRNTEDDGIDIDTLDTARLDVVIRRNVVSGIQDRSLSVVSGGQSILRGLIESNEVTGPADPRVHPALSGDGIGIRARDHSQLHITVRDNRVSQSGRKGLDLNMNRGSAGKGPVNHAKGFFRFEGNVIDGTGQRGLDIQLEDRAFARGLLLENVVANSIGDGIRLRSGAGSNDEITQASDLGVAVVENHVTGSAVGGDAGIFTRAQRRSRVCVRMLGNHSSNSEAGHDYLIRSQDHSTIELAGLSRLAEAGDSSAELHAALLAAGNTGRREEFPAGIRNNAVLPNRVCDFPTDDFEPDLPTLPMLVDQAEFDQRIRR